MLATTVNSLASILHDAADASGIGVFVIAFTAAMFYGVGTTHPLKARRAAWNTREHSGGGFATLVTVQVLSRTRNTQTIRKFCLIRRPGLTNRILNPRWRTLTEFKMEQFHWSTVGEDGLPVAGHDRVELQGSVRSESADFFPPYGPHTFVLIQGTRPRPIIRRLRQEALEPRKSRWTLNTDGHKHPLENSLVGAASILGSLAFLSAFFYSLHLLTTWAGIAGVIFGLWGFYISVTTAERFLLVIALGTAAFGFALGLAHGGLLGGLW